MTVVYFMLQKLEEQNPSNALSSMFKMYLAEFFTKYSKCDVIWKLRVVAFIWRWDYYIWSMESGDTYRSLKQFKTFEAFCKSLYITQAVLQAVHTYEVKKLPSYTAEPGVST